MSGYGGNPDMESEHALILAENGLHAVQSQLQGRVLTYCLECDEEIPKARRDVAIKSGHKCEYCVDCQSVQDKRQRPKIKMLAHIL